MNRRLIDDEGSRNPMSVDQLAERFRSWLDGTWQVDLLIEPIAEPAQPTAETIVGYAVYQLRHDEYRLEATEVYVRQFYIERERRGRGLGSEGYRRLARERFPADGTITLEVLETNPDGRRFWEKLGFAPYCTTLKHSSDHSRGPETTL
jgi:ribosomal protein S18 acetylase RimI-like enzyme